MTKVACPYCGQEAVFTDSSEVYQGQSYGMIYLCRPCEAWVGVHKGTDRALGRLANRDLRQATMAAHAAFDPFWKTGVMTRSVAYCWLARKLRINPKDCHIGMFDEAQCWRVVSICSRHRSNALKNCFREKVKRKLEAGAI